MSIRGSLPNTAFQRAHDLPLWVDLTNDTDPAPWALLLKSLEATRLNTAAPHWLEVRDEMVRKLRDQQQSVNLVVHGLPNWHALRDHLNEPDWLPQLPVAPNAMSFSACSGGLERTLQVLPKFDVDLRSRPEEFLTRKLL